MTVEDDIKEIEKAYQDEPWRTRVGFLLSRIKELEDAIRKHRDNLRAKLGTDNPPFYEEDEQLYKLLDK